MPEFDLLEIFIGAAGLLLVVNGFLALLFQKYYEFFSQTFFPERFSATEKQILREKIGKEYTSSRYVVSAFVIFFGITAIVWALGYKSALGWPFNLLF